MSPSFLLLFFCCWISH